MYDPGAQLCFLPPQCAWATHRHLLLGLPWSTGVHPGGEGHRGGGSSWGCEITQPCGSPASAWPGGAGVGGEGLQWWVFPLGITQQRCSPSLVVQASSASIPVCRAPPSLLSPQDVSSQPTAVLCLVLLSKPHIPAPSPCLQWWTPSQAGWAGLGSAAFVQVSLCPAATDCCRVLFPQRMRLLFYPN